MVHGMHLPWVACSNDLERAFMTLWRWAGSKFKIHTEVHFSLSIWKVPASNVKRWSEEEKAISLKGMSWCAEIPVVDPTHHCCSCCCCTDIDFNQNFPKVPFKSSKENHSNYINSVSQCIDYKSLVRVSLLDLFFFIVKTIYLTFSSMTSVWTFLLSVVWKHCCKFGH